MGEVRPAIPVFNHVAMSVPADALDESGRADILRFYGDVFGWTEMPTMTEDRKRMVLRVHSNEQFVFLVADDDPMKCPVGDHFGMSVQSPDQLHEILEAALKFRDRDQRVEIDDFNVEDHHGVLKLHAFYVRYLLPLRIEVQCFEWAEGFDNNSLPDA
jgi:hypothetical protein